MAGPSATIPSTGRRWCGPKSAELDRLEGIYERLLRDAGATQITGTGRLLDAHTVAVGDEKHRAETIVIATGGRPTMPDIPGIELAVSSDEMFDLPGAARAPGDRGRRLHRLRVRLHHAGSGRAR